MLIFYIRGSRGNKFFCVPVFSTRRFSINYAGIGFARICEMGNAFERINKSGINLTSPSRELRSRAWRGRGTGTGGCCFARKSEKKDSRFCETLPRPAFLSVPLDGGGGEGRKARVERGDYDGAKSSKIFHLPTSRRELALSPPLVSDGER